MQLMSCAAYQSCVIEMGAVLKEASDVPQSRIASQG
jgi:hypothetical protein